MAAFSSCTLDLVPAASGLYFAAMMAHLWAGMRRFGHYGALMGLLLGLAVPAKSRAAEPQGPAFQEIYELLKANLPGVSSADLDHAALRGLLTQWPGRVMLDTNAPAPESSTAQPLLAKSLIYDEAFAYLRIGRMDADLGAAVRKAWQDLSATNKLKGVVLDVRYADGHDYVAAAAVADLFLENERVLLDLGEGAIKSKTKNDAITLPVMILVNGQTAGAAEALAAVLRETKTGLLLGAKTAGQAAVAREFKLTTGQVLRIATAPVKLGNGQALTPEGVKPDIEVQVSAEDEWAYFQDAYAVLQRDPDPAAGAGASSGTVVAGLSTNRPSRSRINEAELVRMRKGESDPDEVAPSRRSRAAEGDKPQVRDPVLVRALDLLKALAVVRRGQTK